MKVICVITMLVVLSTSVQSQSRTARRSAPCVPVNTNQLSVNRAAGQSLVARYVTKAGEQETRLEQIISERKSAALERARLQTELNSAIRALALDRKL
jgi:hypothetical protein